MNKSHNSTLGPMPTCDYCTTENRETISEHALGGWHVCDQCKAVAASGTETMHITDAKETVYKHIYCCGGYTPYDGQPHWQELFEKCRTHGVDVSNVTKHQRTIEDNPGALYIDIEDLRGALAQFTLLDMNGQPTECLLEVWDQVGGFPSEPEFPDLEQLAAEYLDGQN